MSQMTEEYFEKMMNRTAAEEVAIPKGLTANTMSLLEATELNNAHVLPYLVAGVIFINLLIGVLMGTVIYMMRPLTVLDCLIMGSIFASFNALFYGLTYAYRDIVNEFLSELGGM